MESTSVRWLFWNDDGGNSRRKSMTPPDAKPEVPALPRKLLIGCNADSADTRPGWFMHEN